MYLKYTLDRFNISCYTEVPYRQTRTGKSPTCQSYVPGKQNPLYFCAMFSMSQWFPNSGSTPLKHEKCLWRLVQGNVRNIVFKHTGKAIMSVVQPMYSFQMILLRCWFHRVVQFTTLFYFSTGNNSWNIMQMFNSTDRTNLAGWTGGEA